MSGIVTMKELRALALTGDSPLIMKGDGNDKKIGVSFGGRIFQIFQAKDDYNLVRRAVFEALAAHYGENVAEAAFRLGTRRGETVDSFLDTFTSTEPLTGRNIQLMISAAERFVDHRFLTPSDFENLTVGENMALRMGPGGVRAVYLQGAKTEQQEGVAVRQIVLNSLRAYYGGDVALRAYRAGDGEHLGENGEIQVEDGDERPLTTDQIRKMLEAIEKEVWEVPLSLDVSLHQGAMIDWMRRLECGEDVFTIDRQVWLDNHDQWISVIDHDDPGVYRFDDALVLMGSGDGTIWMMDNFEGGIEELGLRLSGVILSDNDHHLWRLDLRAGVIMDTQMSIGIHCDREAKAWRFIVPTIGMSKVPAWQMIKKLNELLKETCGDDVKTIILTPLIIDVKLLGLFEAKKQHWVYDRSIDIVRVSDLKLIDESIRTIVNVPIGNSFMEDFSGDLKARRCTVTISGGTTNKPRMLSDEEIREDLLELLDLGAKNEEKGIQEKNETRDDTVVDQFARFLNQSIARTVVITLPRLMTEEMEDPSSNHWLPQGIDPDERIHMDIRRSGNSVTVVYRQRQRFHQLHEVDGSRRFNLAPGANKTQSKCSVTIDIRSLQPQRDLDYTMSGTSRLDLRLECRRVPGEIIVFEPRTAFEFEEVDGIFRAPLPQSFGLRLQQTFDRAGVKYAWTCRDAFEDAIESGMSIETVGTVDFISKDHLSEDMKKMWGVLLSPMILSTAYDNWTRTLTDHSVIRMVDPTDYRIKIREVPGWRGYLVELRVPLLGLPRDEVVFDYWEEPEGPEDYDLVVHFGAIQGHRTEGVGYGRGFVLVEHPEMRFARTIMNTEFIERVDRRRLLTFRTVDGHLRAMLRTQVGTQFAKSLDSLDKDNCRIKYDIACKAGMKLLTTGVNIDLTDSEYCGGILSPLILSHAYTRWIKDLTGLTVDGLDEKDFEECTVTVSLGNDGTFDIQYRYPLRDFPQDEFTFDYLNEPEDDGDLYLVVNVRAWQEDGVWKCKSTGKDYIERIDR